MTIKAVFFDAGLTLFNVYPYGKPDMFRYFCSLVFEREQLLQLDLMNGAKRAEWHFQVSQKNKEYKRSIQFWIDNYAEGLIGAGLSKEEAYQWAPVIHERVDAIRKEYSLIHGVTDVLKCLKANGYSLAVVSNWRDRSLKNDVEQLGISAYFDYIADSSVEGVSKPDPAIFDIVLSHLGLEPQEAVHIGDLYYSDVIGAQNAGIRAILFDELDALGDVFHCERICKITDILEILKVL